MIELFTWNTPNGQKPAILLEELGLDYTVTPVNISDGGQDETAFRRINPNGNTPALRDGNLTIFESGAVLLHLARKHDQFLGDTEQEQVDALAWSFWQVGGLGPMIGQWGHFLMASEQLPYAINRYLSETIRLFKVLDGRLAEAPYLAGARYTIADMMAYPWAAGGLKFLREGETPDLPDLSNVDAWIGRIAARPAVQAAEAKLSELQSQ